MLSEVKFLPYQPYAKPLCLLEMPKYYHSINYFPITSACRLAPWEDAQKDRRALSERSELARPPL